MTRDERKAAVQELWLNVALVRDRAFKLRDEFEPTSPEYSQLWLGGEDLQQAARRVRRVVDNLR